MKDDLTYAAHIWTSVHAELGLALTADRGEIHSGGGATGLPAPPSEDRHARGSATRSADAAAPQPPLYGGREGGRRGRRKGGEREEEGGEREEGVFIQGNTHTLTHSRCFSLCQFAALSKRTNWCVND